MSGALASVVASIAAQSSARCWLTVTSVIEARNQSRQAAKPRSGRPAAAARGQPRYSTTSRNSTARTPRKTRPSASSASQPPNAGAGVRAAAAATSAACATAVPSSSSQRTRAAGASSASAPASEGTRISASSTSVPQLRELVHGHAVELAVDVEHRDPHDEHGDEQVQQDPDLDGRGQLGAEALAEEEDAVLHHEVADHLRDRLLARDHEQRAREQRGDADGQER